MGAVAQGSVAGGGDCYLGIVPISDAGAIPIRRFPANPLLREMPEAFVSHAGISRAAAAGEHRELGSQRYTKKRDDDTEGRR